MGSVKFVCYVPKGYIAYFLKRMEDENNVDINHQFVKDMNIRKIYSYNNYLIYQDKNSTLYLLDRRIYPIKEIKHIAEYFEFGDDYYIRGLWEYDYTSLAIERRFAE